MSISTTATDLAAVVLPDGRVAIDATCPGCGWLERIYDPTTRLFGCQVCTYESDERNG